MNLAEATDGMSRNVNYQFTRRNIRKNRRLHIESDRSLKSHMEVIYHIYILFNFSLHAFVQYVLSCRKAGFIYISYKCKARVPYIFISNNLHEQHVGQGNGKAIPVQTQRFPEVWSSQISRQSANEGVNLSGLCTARLYPHPSPQEIFLVLTSVRLFRFQCRSAAGRIMSMKNSNDAIGNRNHELPCFSAVCGKTAN